uniref:Uncharacterized protein n=1 Tax=viral metagenome TaxID=1070528 RepID=A0A6C0KFS0_9ZZZZ
MSIQVQPNSMTGSRYAGSCYAFGASGGFFNTQTMSEPIRLRQPDLLTKYDVTDAVQVYFSARTINKKLSIIKDASNFNTVQAWYDPISDTLHDDSLKICACDFIDGVNTESVLSVGKLSSLYFDFKTCVASYFGDPGGFASLFALESEFQVNGGVFDASAYIQTINKSKFTMNGSFVSDLSGSITVNDINRLLKFVVDSNVFNNRNPTVKNYGMIDGFVAGDLIFIPDGFTITLSLDIEPETYFPANNVGPSYLNAIRNRLNWTRGHVKRTTTATTTNITQTTTVPVLMILSDTGVENYTNFGKFWSQSSAIVLDASGNPSDISGNTIWQSISLSTDGQYQTAITDTGNIYRTDSFGQSWLVSTNIGASASNYVAVSFTGMHQTASNGHVIYVSNDYGVTWTPTYNAGTSNIFISISLSGKYQTMVSSGDNVYISDDYGNTWIPLDPDTELYQSIEIFPTAGVCLSYNGQYQTIVVENIYVSDDFGRTWVNVSDDPLNGFNDRNWAGVAMSSDGKYQTAVEAGGDVHVSSDYGKHWLYVDDTKMMDKVWQSVSVSATGQYQTILQKDGHIYTSNDYGATWALVENEVVQNKTWQCISVSADGLLQAAIETGGGIYTSSVFGTAEAPHHVCTC